MPPLPPTTLQEIRRFLAAHSEAQAPWSSSGETLQALYNVLHRHREEDRFWQDLGALVRRLEDRGVHPSLIQGREAYDHRAMDSLLVDLREALPRGDETAGSVSSWARSSLMAPALAAFTLLGVAAGCTVPMTSGDDDDNDATPVELCDQAEALGYGEEEGQVYCELLEIIDGSSASKSDKIDVIDCLETLSSIRREELLTQFQTATEEELATLLDQLAASEECDDWDDH